MITRLKKLEAENSRLKKKECLSIEVDHSLPAQRLIRSLEQLIEWRGKPTQNAYIEKFN
jgi:putative transposase